MQFSYSDKVIDLQKRVTAFMDEHIYPNEKRYDAEMDAAARTATRGCRPGSSRN